MNHPTEPHILFPTVVTISDAEWNLIEWGEFLDSLDEESDWSAAPSYS